MEPIDYTSAFANLQSPVDAFTQGLKGGAEIRQIQFARQQQEAALAQQQQQRADLVELSRNPTPQAIGALMIRYPGMSEQLKRASDVVGSAQQQAHVEHASQVYSAALSGRADIAEKLLTERATALRNSGNEQGAAGAEHFARLVHDNPDQAKTVIGMQLAASMGPDKFAETFGKLGAEQRAAELQPDLVRKGAADAGEAESDVFLKNQGIVAQTAGALAKPGVKPAQAVTMFKSLEARGVIPKGGAQEYIDNIPADPKALPEYLRQVQAAGLSANEQRKYTDVDANTAANNATSRANTAANNATQIKTTGMNNATQLAVQDRIDSRQVATQQFKVEHGVAGLTDEQNEALFGENGAVTTGRLDPNRVNSKTASIFAAAELKNPGTDFSKISSDVQRDRRANTEFAVGKSGAAVRSFNVGLAHLDTLQQLADALDNGDYPAANRVYNAIATQTGKAAPTNFGAAKKIVGDELVKAIVGAGGGVHDREEVAKKIDAANSPAQLKGAISTVQELMVGQLGGLEQQYRATTNRNDFDKYLSPRALEIRRGHGGGAGHGPAPAANGQVIDFGSLR